MKTKFRIETTPFSLHILAMLFMLCDHLWGTVVPRNDWLTCIGQLLCLWYINTEMLGGLAYEISLWGETWFFVRQGFALLVLIPIWLYRGRQGYHNKITQYACYAFYPLHLLILGVVKLL